MAIKPYMPPPVGSMNFNSPGSELHNYAPAWLPVKESVVADPSLFPGSAEDVQYGEQVFVSSLHDEIDTYDPNKHADEVLRKGMIDESSTIFAALRLKVAQRRFDKKQIETREKLDELAHTNEVIIRMGHMALRGENFLAHTNSLRPTTRKELKATKEVSKILARRKLAATESFIVYTNGQPGSGPEGLMTPPANASRREKKVAKRAAKLNHHNREHAAHQDVLFAGVMGHTGDEAVQLINKGYTAAEKIESLKQAVQKIQQKKDVRKAEHEIKQRVKADNKALKDLGPDVIGREWVINDHTITVQEKNSHGRFVVKVVDSNGKEHVLYSTPAKLVEDIRNYGGIV